MLLAPSPRSLRSGRLARVNSLPLHELHELHDFAVINRNNNEDNIKSCIRSSHSPKSSCTESTISTNDEIITSLSLNEQSNISSLNYQTLSIMKNSPLGMTTKNKTRQSNSFDSGCYDQCSSSGDTQSVASSSINQTSSSVPSARLTSASTRRSNSTKKVSFEDPSKTFIVTTAIYV